MIVGETIRVTVNGATLKWYRSRGYDIPVREVQLFMNHKGRRIKNGTKLRVERGTVIHVKPADLLPGSNRKITFRCETCENEFTTTWQAHRQKISNNCCSCQAKKQFNGGHHEYWVKRLLDDNPDARCDISGETDKRFLVLHHLMSRSIGGQNDPSNYVVLSANYHVAFHKWMGGTGVPCRPEDYARFRAIELGAA